MVVGEYQYYIGFVTHYYVLVQWLLSFAHVLLPHDGLWAVIYTITSIFEHTDSFLLTQIIDKTYSQTLTNRIIINVQRTSLCDAVAQS